MKGKSFEPRRHTALNLAAVILIAASFNWTTALIFGRPLLYCALANSALGREAMGFYHFGLLLLGPLAVIGVLRGKGDGPALIVATLLFAALPAFVDTLFNLPPGCPAQPP